MVMRALALLLLATPAQGVPPLVVPFAPAIITLDAKLTPVAGSAAAICLTLAEQMSSAQASAFSDRHQDVSSAVYLCPPYIGSGAWFPPIPLKGTAHSLPASGLSAKVIIPATFYSAQFFHQNAACLTYFNLFIPDYYVDASVGMNAGRKSYVFAQLPLYTGVDPFVDKLPAPNQRLMNEAPGVIHVRLLCPETGNPLRTISAVRVSAVLTTGPHAGTTQAEIRSLASGATTLDDILFVRGNETYNVDILYTSNTDDYLDKFTWGCTANSLTVPANAALKTPVDCIGLPCINGTPCADGSFNYFGHIVGYADLLGGIIESTGTRIVADGGLYGNYRYGLLNPTTASGGGPYLLTNVMALNPAGPIGQDYRVYANMTFPISGQTEEFTTPCTTAHVDRCQTTDIGDILVMNPGYVQGNILLKGLADEANCPCLNLLDLPASRAAANGPCTGAASVTFAGTTSAGTFSGNYRMALAGLKPGSGQPDQSVWNPNVLALRFSDAGLGVNSAVTITDNLFANQTIVAGATINNDHQYCFSSVTFRFVNATPSRPFSNPQIAGSGAFSSASDFLSNPANYGVSVSASGPSVATATFNEGTVLTCLPAGTYTVTPAISYPEGSATVPDITFTVGCMEKIIIDVLVKPTNCCPPCFPPYPSSYTVNVVPDFNYLVNHLCSGANNTLEEVLPTVPDGAQVYKWNKALQTFDGPSTYSAGSGWFPSTTLAPGEGFALFNPGPAFVLTFRGCESTCPPPCGPTNGYCFVGRIGIGTATWTNLFSCPPECGTQLILLNPDQTISTFDYVNGGWLPYEPVLAVGQSAFVSVQDNTNCCLRVSNERLVCATNIPGKLNYSFTLKNSTGVPVKHVFLVPKTNCFTFSQDIFTFKPPLSPGQTTNLSVMINFTGDCPSNLCFLIAALDSNFVNCCSIMHCVERDTTPPVITGCTNILVALTNGQSSASVNYVVTATDASSPPVTLLCTPPAPGPFPLGTTLVTCVAVDACGNSNTCQFDITVANNCPCLATTSAPVNDTPAGASPLTAPAMVSGCLTYAGPTPLGVVSTFPPVPPLLSQQGARDVWFSFRPTVGGVVTVDTCGATDCPSDTVLAVYQGAPSALLVNPSGLSGQNWYNNNMSPVCSFNPLASQVKFNAKACVTYYLRVSARNPSIVPGGFRLNLTQIPAAPPLNDACGSPRNVSANSSTRFDNSLATTGVTPALPPIFNDVWHRFVAPPLAVNATVEICTTFNAALAVYTGNNCNNLVLVPLTLAAASCPPGATGLKVTFPVVPGRAYRVRVGGVTGTDVGCGFVRISSGLPPVNTPPVGTPNQCKTYTVLGRPSGQPWSWTLTSPRNCRFNLQGNVAGVPTTGTAFDVATAFAASINAAAGQILATAVVAIPVRAEQAYLKICTPCPVNQVVLKVGPLGNPDCWVANQALLGAIAPCVFNPSIYEIADPDASGDDAEADCNGNGQSDYLDLVLGTSLDADGNTVPDECPIRLNLTYESSVNELVVSWPATDAILEQSTNVNGPWVEVLGATSPHVVGSPIGQTFFRLRVP